MMKTIAFLIALPLALSLSKGVYADEPKKDAEGFEKVDSSMTAPGESIPADRLVAAAYGFIFGAVVVYAASVAARTRRVEEEMDELRRKLEKK
jgi:hypothetical protein